MKHSNQLQPANAKDTCFHNIWPRDTQMALIFVSQFLQWSSKGSSRQIVLFMKLRASWWAKFSSLCWKMATSSGQGLNSKTGQVLFTLAMGAILGAVTSRSKHLLREFMVGNHMHRLHLQCTPFVSKVAAPFTVLPPLLILMRSDE